MTRKYQHALVIGKFYPPHLGHLHTITAAAEMAEHVSVIIYDSRFHTIRGADKKRWLETDLANPRVSFHVMRSDIYDDYESRIVWDAHMTLMEAFMRAEGITGLDVVVASEDYANVMAQEYFGGIAAEIVDSERLGFPISGTLCREDIVTNWEYLTPSTRRDLMPRVIVLGAESTGTSTLSTALAEHYGARWIEEYGARRTWDLFDINGVAVTDDIVWDEQEFEHIGTTQTALEELIAARTITGISEAEQKTLESLSPGAQRAFAASQEVGGLYPLLIGDTDALATAVWEKRYVEGVSLETALERRYANELPRRDLYIITDHVGVPFVENGIRNSEMLRESMGVEFEDALTERGYPWIRLGGTEKERLEVAIAMIDALLTVSFEFADPKRFAR